MCSTPLGTATYLIADGDNLLQGLALLGALTRDPEPYVAHVQSPSLGLQGFQLGLVMRSHILSGAAPLPRLSVVLPWE